LAFHFFGRFLAQFSNTISKASNLHSTKVLSQVDSNFADPILHGIKKSLFFKKNLKKSIYAICTRSGVLECSFLNQSQGILGVKYISKPFITAIFF
jgi:hypothetical protein